MSRTIEAINAAIEKSKERIAEEKAGYIGRYVSEEESEAIAILEGSIARVESITNRLPKYDDRDWFSGLPDDDKAIIVFLSAIDFRDPIWAIAQITRLPDEVRESVRALGHQYFTLMAATECDYCTRGQLRGAAACLSTKSPYTLNRVTLRDWRLCARAHGIGPQYPVF